MEDREDCTRKSQQNAFKCIYGNLSFIKQFYGELAGAPMLVNRDPMKPILLDPMTEAYVFDFRKRNESVKELESEIKSLKTLLK